MVPASLLALLLSAAPWQTDTSQPHFTRPRAQTVRTETPPVIDGRLDDACWASAIPIGSLTQVEPEEGGTPSQRSEIRILHDDEHIYIGLRLYDTEPDRIIAIERERDAFLRADDRVEIVIDTFLDRRSAFFFQLSAAGSKGDALITQGPSFNKPWDGIWEGKTTIDEEGWTAEFALPFKTMSFRPGLSTWGFNVSRHIGRTVESCRWSGPFQNVGMFNLGIAGDLSGIEEFQQGIGLDFVPFFTTRLSNDRDNETEHLLGDPGFDLFYKVTPNLTLSATVNTDFAETEVDDRQINLTRFPLFFPERRDFFLQDSGLFSFSSLGREVIPFFSRRIGLRDGEEVGLLGGIKLTGRAGPFNIGLLDIETDDEGEIDGQNLGVARVSRNIGEESEIGGIVTSGDPNSSDRAQVYGLDATFRTTHFRGNEVLRAGLFWLRSDNEGVSGDDESFGAFLTYPNDRWSAALAFKEIGQEFDPRLGFVPRRGIRRYDASVEFAPRMDEFVRQLAIELESSVITDTDGELETVVTEFQPYGLTLESGDALRMEIVETHEELSAQFEIVDGVTIPAGSYDFTRFRIETESANKRMLALGFQAEAGEFFDGHRERYATQLDYRPSPLFTLAAEFEHNDVRLDGGSFQTQLARIRLNSAFSPKLTWKNFLQWDSESASIGLNSRLRWIPRPGTEIFLVINQVQDLDRSPHGAPALQEVAFKVFTTLRF